VSHRGLAILHEKTNLKAKRRIMKNSNISPYKNYNLQTNTNNSLEETKNSFKILL
jgi:hypothetical protein